MNTTRCTRCSAEFTDEELKDAKACPKCGTESLPCAIADDVSVKINWHELRILTMWASNWAGTKDFPESGRQSLGAIIARLEKQFPDKAPLTLAGEVRKLQDEFPGAELRHGDDVVVPPKKVQ